jgi:hypothetical protein
MEKIMLLNPFITESAHTNAIVDTITPQTDTNEMMLIALCDFLEKR